MVQYLSDEWIQRAGEALSGDDALAAATAEMELSIAYEVTGAPGGKRSYTVTIDRGAVSLTTDSGVEPSVTFGLDYDTAAEIARGDLAAQAAFMQGRLKLGGDVNVLIRQHAAIDGLTDALAGLRSETEY